MVSGDERLIALWHALDSTELGRTKADLRRVVPGYGDLSSDDAFERMFSRDKAALRQAGVFVETRSPGTLSERYRLAKANTNPVIDLTPAEVGAVRLAAQIWQAGDLGDTAENAFRRLIGTDFTPEVAAEIEYSAPIPFIPAKGDLLPPLVKAISNRCRVRFDYRNTTTGEIRERFVEPWRLAFRDGGWYLLGKDMDVGTARAFRLSRICSPIFTVELRHAFPAVSEIDVSELLGETGHYVSAMLAIAPGRAAKLRTAGQVVPSQAIPEPQRTNIPAGYEIFRYDYDDEREFADEIAGFGPNVVVLSPPQLRAAVLKRLKAAAGLSGVANA